jgi:hypothetical protein
MGALGRGVDMTTDQRTPIDFTQKVARYQLAFGIIASLAGAAGFIHARDVDFTASSGASLGWGSYELTLMSYNRLGALLTLVLGLVGVATASSRSLRLGVVPAIGFLAIFVIGLVQVRAEGGSLGISPQTMAFSLAMALGFGVTAAVAHTAPDLDLSEPTLDPEEP